MIDDLRQAFRAIARMPALAAVVIVSLGVGIGVNTTVFSWLEAIVLKPLPGVADVGRIHAIEPRAESGSYPGVSWLEYRDLGARIRSIPDLIAYRMVALNVGESWRTERTFALLVSGNYFAGLGLSPSAGRFLQPDDAARPGGEPVVVISHDYWQTRFAGAPDVIGRPLRANGRLLTIVGVAPPRFQGTVLGLSFSLWVPATLAPPLLGSSELDDRALRGYAAIGRIAPHVSRAQAQAEADEAMRQLARLYPDSNRTMRAEVLPFWQSPHGPQRLLAGAILLLQTILLLLLLAVCGNTANLLLARASARQKEIGVRLALGAGPWRVARLLLVESLVLALLGAALGAAIAVWGTNALRAAPMIGAFPIRFQTGVDGIGLAFTTGLAVACGLIFGMAPAVELARIDPLRAFQAAAATSGRSGLRHALMATEVALAIVVLMAAALFLRSFNQAREIDPGFRREGVLLAAYDLSGRRIDAAAARDFGSRLLARVRALPAVESAAIATSVPLDIHGMPLRAFALEGRARTDGAADRALVNVVTSGYFRTMGIPIRAGMDFVELDDSTTPRQAIVNEEFVRRYVGDAQVLGRRIDTRGASYRIAAIVATSTYEAFGETPIPMIYLSFRDRSPEEGEIHIRTRPGAETLLAPEIERIVRTIDPTLPLYDVRTLSDHVEKNLFLRRIPARLFVVLGPLLLVLAAIGIYAVVDFTVARRTTEIGIRLALGASVSRVVAQIVRETMQVVAAGAIAGWVVTVGVNAHLLRGPLYPSVFVSVPLALMTVAAAACWLPARRAAGADPAVSLRRE